MDGRPYTGRCGHPACFRRGFVLHLKTSKHAGDFHLDSLPEGRIDLLARVCTNAFFMSFGVRRNSVFAASLAPPDPKKERRSGYGAKQGDQTCPGAALAPTVDRDADGKAAAKRCRREPPGDVSGPPPAAVGTVLCIDGNAVKHLRPDERNTAALIKRLLDPPAPNARKIADHAKRHGMSIEDAGAAMAAKNNQCVAGLSHKAGGLLDALAAAMELVGRGTSGAPFVLLLHEKGVELSLLLEARARDSGDGALFPNGVVLVVGDNVGLSEAEQLDLVDSLRAGGVPFATASLGAQPLLASQCVAISHYLLDRYHVCERRA
eukprot:TRINITY_DN6903_c1_g3_i1.p1 TRINITY_DN6903_c1_g3~~TRINITY_DN6903_c1_g3_i1.p1  ORF type:complete len:320 (+),score=99.62 TRINITY_DN6903_c1_g3_i1:48-1007(+)